MTTDYRICLVDDDLVVREALITPLRDLGFEVASATGVWAAFDMAERQHFDAFVVDYLMPGFGGETFVPRARELWPKSAIVVVSGMHDIGGRPLESAALALGADAALRKPFRARDLAVLLLRLIALRSRAA